MNLSFPHLVDMARICLVQPISNATVERGASAVKRVKTRLRNRMKNDMSSLLHCSINGPAPHSQECDDMITEATSLWRRSHKRNLPPPTSQSHSGRMETVATSDCAVQTENADKDEETADKDEDPEMQEMLSHSDDHEQPVYQALKELDMFPDSESDADSDYEFDFDLDICRDL